MLSRLRLPAALLLLQQLAESYGAVYITIAQSNKSTYGGRLNKKDGLTRYGDSHVKDKTS